MPTEEKIKEGYRLLGIDSVEKRKKIKKIIAISNGQQKLNHDWKVGIVKNLEGSGWEENTIA